MGSVYTDNRITVDNCSFAKTILFVVVVLGHSVHFWTDDWFMPYTPVFQSYALMVLSHFISNFHIYAFTLISGYLFYYTKTEQKHYASFSDFFIVKAKRLLIPYFFAMVAWLIPVRVVLYGLDMPVIIDKYILAQSPDQLWFLWMLFGVFMLSWPLSKLYDKLSGGGGY